MDSQYKVQIPKKKCFKGVLSTWLTKKPTFHGLRLCPKQLLSKGKLRWLLFYLQVVYDSRLEQLLAYRKCLLGTNYYYYYEYDRLKIQFLLR